MTSFRYLSYKGKQTCSVCGMEAYAEKWAVPANKGGLAIRFKHVNGEQVTRSCWIPFSLFGV